MCATDYDISPHNIQAYRPAAGPCTNHNLFITAEYLKSRSAKSFSHVTVFNQRHILSQVTVYQINIFLKTKRACRTILRPQNLCQRGVLVLDMLNTLIGHCRLPKVVAFFGHILGGWGLRGAGQLWFGKKPYYPLFCTLSS